MIKSIIAGAFTNTNNDVSSLLNNLSKKSKLEEFQNEFLLQLSNISLSTIENKLVEVSLESAALFVVQSTLSNKQESRLFLSNIFNFICEKHENKSSLFISRLYYFLNLIIKNRWKLNAHIFDADYNDYWDKIIDTMFNRITDSSIKIRIGAICVLGWFQNLRSNDCKILDTYIKYLSNDSSPEVRKAIINNIGINDKSIKALLKKIHDKNESVRTTAYIFFCLEQLNLDYLTLEERQDILNNGLQESNEIISIIKTKLLPTWLKFYNNNILNLLSHLDVKNNTDNCIKILDILFQKTDIKTLTNELPLHKNVIQIDKLTCNNIVYWYCFVKHCETMSNVISVDKVLPRTRRFTCYIQHFINMTSPQMNNDQNNPFIFILRKLFEMIEYIVKIDTDNGDIFLKNLIEYTLLCGYVYDDKIIELATMYYAKIVPDVTSRINLLSLFIKIIKYPIQQQQQQHDDNIKIMKKCLNIINGIIKKIPDNTMTTELELLYRTVVLDSFENNDYDLQLSALKTIGLFLISNGEFAKKYIKKIYNVLLLSSDYPSDKWIMALNIIFDLFLKFGLDYFDVKYTDDDVMLINNTPWFIEEIHSHILNNQIIKLLIKLIDYNKIPEIENIVIDGFWKLINNDVVTNNHLIRRILNKDVQIIHEENIIFVDDKRRIKNEIVTDIVDDNNDVYDQVTSTNIIDEKPVIIDDQLVIEDSNDLNILTPNDPLIESPIEEFLDQDDSDVLWQGSMRMTDIAESSVTIDGFDEASDNILLKNLSNILNINSEICHRFVWSYLTKLLKINSNNIHVFKITATNDEEKLSYITLWSYFNRRRKIGFIHDALDNHDFFIISSASKKKNLPKFLGSLVQEFLDNCDDRYLLLGIMCERNSQVVLAGPKLLIGDHGKFNNTNYVEDRFSTSSYLENIDSPNNEKLQNSKKRNLQSTNCDHERNKISENKNGTFQNPYVS
ncbi:hypothetical protein HCN44_003043 [Aphidius gifuensis]|uniref:Uncharacterized protein n=1 Tax=Aphidius gifuensis TaxID=684658 RepID=A0A834XI08_APHGI|nr:hypothetical protein HCN44_003043 [Aphidius gifuensis]